MMFKSDDNGMGRCFVSCVVNINNTENVGGGWIVQFSHSYTNQQQRSTSLVLTKNTNKGVETVYWKEP